MFDDEIKEYYDAITPSDETRNALLQKIKHQRKKRATYKLVFECFVSAAACFLFAVVINYTKVSGSAETPDKLIGTVLSEPNGYVIGGMLLAVLVAAFLIIYRKKIKGHTEKKHKESHEC